MPNLNSMQPQVREIVKYLWSSEACNYARMLAGGEEVESHIFVSLMQVSNVLNGTKTNAKLWAFEQYNKLFEKMFAGHTCPGCDEGTLNLVPAETRNPEHLLCSNCESIYAVVKEPERVSKEEWEEFTAKETPGEIHPCNHWTPEDCMCEGVCSCHWKQLEKKDGSREG